MAASNQRGPLGARGVAARVVAGLATVAIALCGLAALGYANGSDPLALVTGGLFQTVEEPAAASGEAATGNAGSGAATGTSAATDASTGRDAATAETGAPVGDGSSAGAPAESGVASSDGTLSSGSSGTEPSEPSGEQGGQPQGPSEQASGPTSEPSAPARPSEPSTITVTVTVDASAVGAGSSSARVAVEPGASVYDALVATGVSVNARNTPLGVYVAAIGGLAEKEHGGESGWKYAVNGVDGDRSAGKVTLSDGDSVRWRYVLSVNG